MIKTVEKFLIDYNIKDKNVILGFSCGPDSCALALLLNELKEKYNLNIILAYFNHMWRKEALEEEKFACKFADKYNLKCFIDRADKNIKKTEEDARNLRYAFFEKCASKFSSDIVFLAHNKNDNIETLIYRVIKGTSIKGLTSIPENREIYYRPLLCIEKKEILEFLAQKKQEFLFDFSNDDTKYNRNLIRKEILPYFEKINPNYLNNIEILIKNAKNSSKIIENNLEKIKKDIFLDDKIVYEKYVSLNIELRYEILNDFVGGFLKNRDYKTIKKIDEFILNNICSKISLNNEIFLKIKNSKIFIEKKVQKNNSEIQISSCGEYFFEDIIFKIEKVKKNIDAFPKETANYCFLNLPNEFNLTLRHRKNGDKFSPLGINSNTAKLKDFLINNKVEQEKKDKLFVLASNNEICWVLGMKISEKFKVCDNNFYRLEWKQL